MIGKKISQYMINEKLGEAKGVRRPEWDYGLAVILTGWLLFGRTVSLTLRRYAFPPLQGRGN